MAVVDAFLSLLYVFRMVTNGSDDGGTPGPRRRRRQVDGCPCGGSSDGFRYRRGMFSGTPSRGFWYCGDCGDRVMPNPRRAYLSAAEKDRLRNLKQLYENDGWGDLYAHERLLACAIPQGASYVVALVPLDPQRG